MHDACLRTTRAVLENVRRSDVSLLDEPFAKDRVDHATVPGTVAEGVRA
jgi:hypothetical protein